MIGHGLPDLALETLGLGLDLGEEGLFFLCEVDLVAKPIRGLERAAEPREFGFEHPDWGRKRECRSRLG